MKLITYLETAWHRPELIVACVTALNLIAIVITQLATREVPEVLTYALTALVGALAGLLTPQRSVRSGDIQPPQSGAQIF